MHSLERLSVVLICVVLLTLGLTAICLPAGGQTPPPATGDWTVSDNTVIKGQVINLTGNLTITTSGHLVLRNCTLVFNCSTAGEFTLEVAGSLMGSKGKLEAYNTTFKSNGTGAYWFKCAGIMTLEECDIMDVHGSLLDIMNPGGIYITSSNVLIQDCTVTQYAAYGIVASGSSPTIRDTTVSGNLSTVLSSIGIMVSIGFGVTNPVIDGCDVSYNLVGIQIIGAGMGVVTGEYMSNTLSFNGAGLNVMMATADVHHNSAALNAVGMAGLGDSSTFGFNNITANGMGIAFSMGSDASVEDNDISLNLGAGVMVNGSSPVTIDGNTISTNGAWGILSQDSNPVIEDNTLEGNVGTTIEVENGVPTILDNTITLVSRGMFLVNCTDMNIRYNNLTGGNDALGVEMVGCSCDSSINNVHEIDLGDGSTGMVIRSCEMNVSVIADAGSDSTGITITDSDVILGCNGVVNDGLGLEITNSTVFADGMFQTGGDGVIITDGSNVTMYDLRIIGTGFHPGTAITVDDSYLKLVQVLMYEFNYGMIATSSTIWSISSTYQFIDNLAFIGTDLFDLNETYTSTGDVNGNPTNLLRMTHLITNSTVSNILLIKSYHKFVDCPSFLDDIVSVTPYVHSSYEVCWTTNVRVIDGQGAEVSGADVEITDNTTTIFNQTTTGSGGLAGPFVIPEYRVEGFTRTNLTPYTFKASTATARGQTTSDIQAPSTIVVTLADDLGPGPVAYLGPTQTHNPEPTIMWEEGTDPNGDDITYSVRIGTWSTGSDVVNLDGLVDTSLALDNMSTLMDLEYGPTYFIRIKPVDSTGLSGPWTQATLQLTNTAPVFSTAGPFQVDIDADEALNFTLNASDSDVGPVDVLTYATTSDIEVNSTTGQVYWEPGREDVGIHCLNFSVSDGIGGLDTLEVFVSVVSLDRVPIADAGDDLIVYEGDLVELDGSGSYDPDGSTLLFDWTVEEGNVTVNGSWLSTPNFIAPAPGNYSFGLVVTDVNSSVSPMDIVNVTVLPKIIPPQPKIVLFNMSYGPALGYLDSQFIFRTQVLFVNWTINNWTGFWENRTGWLIHLVIDGNDTGVSLNPIVTNASKGPDYFEARVVGTFLGLGNHTFGFVVNHSVVEGDLGPYSGLRVIEEPASTDGQDGTQDEPQDKGGSVRYFWVLVAVAVVLTILSCCVLYFYIRTQRSVEDPDGFPEGYWPHIKQGPPVRPVVDAGEVQKEPPKATADIDGPDPDQLALPPASEDVEEDEPEDEVPEDEEPDEDLPVEEDAPVIEEETTDEDEDFSIEHEKKSKKPKKKKSKRKK